MQIPRITAPNQKIMDKNPNELVKLDLQPCLGMKEHSIEIIKKFKIRLHHILLTNKDSNTFRTNQNNTTYKYNLKTKI